VLSDIIPGRIGAVTVFAAALLLALSADGWWRLAVQHDTRRRQVPHQRHSRYFLALFGTFLALVTAGTLVPVGATYSFPYVIFKNPVPVWFRHVAPNLAAGTVLLVYPFPEQVTAQAMGWQAVDDMQFRIVGGFVIVPGRDGKHSAFVSIPGGAVGILDALSLRYLGPLPLATPDAVNQVHTSVHHWGVQDVVVTTQGRDPVYAVGFLTAVIGRLPRFQRGAWVWYGLGDNPPLHIDPAALTHCVRTAPSFYSRTADKLFVPKCVLAAGQGSAGTAD
jgi:hypothetical protein